MSIIKSKSFMFIDKSVKIVIQVTIPTYTATLRVNRQIYSDEFNLAEPFDRCTHIFTVPVKEFKRDTALIFSAKPLSSHLPAIKTEFTYGMPEYRTRQQLIEEYDNRLHQISLDTQEVCDGVNYSHILYQNRHGAPVHAFVTEFNPQKAEIYIGTPHDGCKSKNVKATIPQMIAAAEKNGHSIVAGVNGDFFDMFGDNHPSGLCVKNRVVVANPHSERTFIGLTKDGRHIITSLKENPEIINNLTQAASGMQQVLRNGEIFDFAPLEPFSYTPHPRTCVGIKENGNVLLLVVDGRIPEYSNGASLVDLALLMKSYGASDALNMDGGGSSAMYTKKGSTHVLHSRPADLVKPTAGLIRKDFNAILIKTNYRY